MAFREHHGPQGRHGSQEHRGPQGPGEHHGALKHLTGAFPNISKYLNEKFKTANDISMYLLSKQSVVSVPGDSFGAPINIRFSYATSIDDFQEAMNRFKLILKELN